MMVMMMMMMMMMHVTQQEQVMQVDVAVEAVVRRIQQRLAVDEVNCFRTCF